MSQDDPEIRRAAQRQISLRGAGARAFAAAMVEQYRYESGHTYLMWAKILAKIEELQPVRQDPEDFPHEAGATRNSPPGYRLICHAISHKARQAIAAPHLYPARASHPYG
jgi:hypothetical protein